MRKVLLQWLINAGAVYAVAHFMDGIYVRDFWSALSVALVLGVINAVLKPILVFFSIPLLLFTLGFFMFFINALLLLIASWLVGGFQVQGFWVAALASLFISIISGFGTWFFGIDDKKSEE